MACLMLIFKDIRPGTRIDPLLAPSSPIRLSWRGNQNLPSRPARTTEPHNPNPIYQLKTTRSIATASVVLLAICHSYGVSFSYSYSDVFQSSAEDFLVSQSNVQKVNEGIVHYYSPVTTGAPASLTYHFDLSGTIIDASLFAHLASYNFGGDSFGFGSLWGSTDGTSWQLLMDAPSPSGIAEGYFYNQSLPSSLIGDSDLWIQVRMQSSGASIFSQFSRTDISVPIEIFRFDATVAAVPDYSSTLLLLGGALLFLAGIRPLVGHAV